MKPISARNARKVFGTEVAVDGVDFDVAVGQIHAIVGLNGAGKTTLMKMLVGMVQPDSGEVALLGVPVVRAGSATWAKVGHLISAPFGYRELSVEENLRAICLLRGIPGDEVGSRVDQAIDVFELGHWKHRRARTLSLGNRQRLGLACSLIHRPEVIILDEPSNGLDPGGVVFLRDLLRAQADAGASIMVSSHHLDELARIADRVSMLHRGRLVGSLDPEGIDLERQFFDAIHTAEASLENRTNV